MSTGELVNNADRENRRKASSGKKKKIITFKGTPIFISGGFSIPFMIIVFALLTIGLIMMFSASYVTAKYENGDSMFYIKRQLVFAVGGIFLMFFVSKLNPELLKKLTVPIFVICLLLLVVVLIKPWRPEGMSEDFKRWLRIPGIGSFQPSDIAKLGIIMFFAWAIDKYKTLLENKWWAALVLFGITAALCLLIYMEKHLSCTILIFLICIGMMFLGGIDNRWFALGLAIGVPLVVTVIAFRHQILSEYQAARIDSFFVKDYDDIDTRWQTNQSLFALGSGGFFGLGLGNSKQKYLYMSEPQNDFIFAIVGEELGFVRCVLILLLFALLIFVGFMIADKSRSLYNRLLVLGIMLHIGLQTILNILVVTDMMPNTGISLPFFSYGGTALVMQLIEMGIVLSVSRTVSEKAKVI
ncbi:MAG: FtsW/RodA/SpoVE family cell cycle protein [Clostridia bacterium]|nr:FtsW/RodA/SpoVE family cell cycle protein [Clostridia bacterium]